MNRRGFLAGIARSVAAAAASIYAPRVLAEVPGRTLQVACTRETRETRDDLTIAFCGFSQPPRDPDWPDYPDEAELVRFMEVHAREIFRQMDEAEAGELVIGDPGIDLTT